MLYCKYCVLCFLNRVWQSHMLVVHAAIKCDLHDIFIRADSRLYGSQSEAAMEPGIKAGFYAKNKRSTGDPNLRSLHNYGNRGVGDGAMQRLRCWRENIVYLSCHNSHACSDALS